MDDKTVVMFFGMVVSFGLGHYLGAEFAINKIRSVYRMAATFRIMGKIKEADEAEREINAFLGVK